MAQPRNKRVGGAGEAERERINRSFLAMALAHEIKQPLNALGLNGDLLSRRMKKLGSVTAECMGPLESILGVVDRVNGCVESFIPHVAPDAVPEEPVDLRPAFEESLASARAAARPLGVRIVDDVPADLPAMTVHPVQLGVALDYLLENAIRASRRGATVTLRAEIVEEDLKIEVSDEGDGMPPEIAKRAHEIGFSSWGRPGVGLTVAKFIAYFHGGSYRLQSTVGKGTTVTLMFSGA